MEENLNVLLQEIDKCYLLAGQELLEREKLEAVESKIRSELGKMLENLDDELLSLKYKKIKQ